MTTALGAPDEKKQKQKLQPVWLKYIMQVNVTKRDAEGILCSFGGGGGGCVSLLGGGGVGGRR